jgi:hypothetical protein
MILYYGYIEAYKGRFVGYRVSLLVVITDRVEVFR